MSELSKLFTKVTGLTNLYDVDKMIEKADTEEKQKKLMVKLLWCIKKGEAFENVPEDSDYAKLLDELDYDDDSSFEASDIEAIRRELLGEGGSEETADSAEDTDEGVEI